MAAGPGGFWDALRAWADGAGLLQPQDPQDGPRPRVPQAVCDNCPICQGAATLDQVNPDVVHELADLARGVVLGLGSALSSAADQRLGDPGARGAVAPDEDDDDTPDEQDDPPTTSGAG
ncbi:MAG: hypothetical protein MUD13_08105 [Candidatus Nanopelagicales bacterium]|jgi:hypothetical protein|nr:hypothetical protein [Candidatus Nanopelagicales bacterium]